jgi:hypothetical protein
MMRMDDVRTFRHGQAQYDMIRDSMIILLHRRACEIFVTEMVVMVIDVLTQP